MDHISSYHIILRMTPLLSGKMQIQKYKYEKQDNKSNSRSQIEDINVFTFG